MENQTVTIEQVKDLAEQLGTLDKASTQEQFAGVIAGSSLIQIAAVSNHGDRISGSAERAVAAWFNSEFPLSITDDNWFEVNHGETSEIAKKLAVPKKEVYDCWKSSNPSTKYRRVRKYGRELAEPMLLGMIAALPEDERELAYLENDLINPATQPEDAPETPTTNSRNRDLYERSVFELGKLYRALNATDNDAVIKAHAKGQELQNALVDVTNALKSLGAPTEDADLVDYMESVTKR